MAIIIWMGAYIVGAKRMATKPIVAMHVTTTRLGPYRGSRKSLSEGKTRKNGGRSEDDDDDYDEGRFRDYDNGNDNETISTQRRDHKSVDDL